MRSLCPGTAHRHDAPRRRHGALLVLALAGLLAAAAPAVAAGSCSLTDEGEGEGEGEPAFAEAPHATGLAARSLRHAVPLVASLVVLGLAVPATRRFLENGRGTAILSVCALLAVANYTLIDRRADGRFVNPWELFHYYLGSKYAAELGYTGLYAAALVADEEAGLTFAHPSGVIRDLATGGCVPVDEVLDRRAAVVGRFSPDRWEEFTRDVGTFRSSLGQERWSAIFHDKGYNPTPVWTLMAAPLTRRVPASSPAGMLALALLDPLLMLVTVAVVWRTFGSRAALLMLILVGTHMTMSHTHMKGALLRTDWVMSLVLAVCALKVRRPALAGTLAALSAASRVFPALFAAGLLAGPAIAWATGERPRRRQVRFGIAFVAALGFLVLLSVVVAAPGTWQGFAEKIWQHHDSFSPWRVGFKHVFLGAIEYRPPGLGTHQETFRERWLLWWTIQALVLGGFLLLCRRLRDWEILALGFVPMFFLVSPTYYYYMVLVVPLLFFCGRALRPERALGVIGLFTSSTAAYLIEGRVGRELPLFYALSLMILGLSLVMCLGALREAMTPERAPERWTRRRGLAPMRSAPVVD